MWDTTQRSAFYGGDVADLGRGTHYASPVATIKGVSAFKSRIYERSGKNKSVDQTWPKYVR